MAKLILTVFISFFLTQVFGQLKPKGTFIGAVPMTDCCSPDKPQYKWYHLSELTFKGDSVYLEQSPIAIYKTDTIFSASDGGFYSYAGKLRIYKGHTFADLTLLSCDYCPNQFIKFIPPKLVRDPDSTQTNFSDTVTTIVEPPMIENTYIKYKAMLLEKTQSPSTLLLNGILYRRIKKQYHMPPTSAFVLCRRTDNAASTVCSYQLLSQPDIIN